MAGLFDHKDGGLVTYWKTVAGITSLVGSGTAARIYPDFAKEKVAVPYIVFVRVGGGAATHLAGVSGARLSILHVYCYGASPSAADALAEVVRQNSANYRGTLSGVYVNWIECSDAPDSGVDLSRDGSDAQRYWVRVILRITHAEALGV